MANKNKIEIFGDDIMGYSYPIKDKLKDAGCVWSSQSKLWRITKTTDLDKVSQAINDYNVGGTCDKCSAKCKAGFHICYNCYKNL